MKNILVTGGAGYIGSHTCLELLNSNYGVTVVDNLSNSSTEPLRRIEELTGKKIDFIQMDIRDYRGLCSLIKEKSFYAVIHFAGLKAVGESVAMPIEYYDNNVYGSLSLFRAMRDNGLNKIIFSSSATVYGNPETVPITEDFPVKAVNPYGRSKLFIEEILKDIAASDSRWKVVILRYFNPIGAHESGRIGESPKGIPNNLMPYITQVAVGRLPELNVFGNDYPTIDGTGVRDYIHVVDLAKGHLSALDNIGRLNSVEIFNLGTGRGYSVLEIVKAFEEESGKKIPYKICSRRPGDVALCYADASKAKALLGWSAKKNINDMCRDSWNWQSKNPAGYCEQ